MRSFQRLSTFIAALPAVVLSFAICGFAWGAVDNNEPVERRIAKLIDQLGADDFHARQRAEHDLLKIGAVAIDALNDATDNDDLEIAERAKFLLKLIPIELVRDSDPPNIKTLLENYDSTEPERRAITMAMLAKEPRGQGVEALCRLVRYEKSLALSRQAALHILSMPDPEPADWAKRTKIVVDALEGSRRTGAGWLRTFVKATTEPDVALAEWDKWIAEEEAALAQNGPTGEAFLVALLRRQAVTLEKLNRRDDAVAAIRKVINYEHGNPETLAELIEWLAGHASFDLVDEVAKRFERTIQQDIWLCYVLADARLLQGNKPLAAELADKAFNMPPDRRAQQLPAHLTAAAQLQRRGRMDWAEREYKDLIQQPASRIEGLQARINFAELLHDQDRDLEAASALSAFDGALKNTSIDRFLERVGRNINSVRARRQYFQALAQLKDNHVAGAMQLLETAHKADPFEADVLIAMYRATEADPKKRADVVRKVKAAATKFRQEIDDDTDNPINYNQLAWLISNTEGDFDEALNCSLKSLEIVPGAAGYLDTLSHCYFAKQDYANAVATQTRAAELDPHSGVIVRELKRFQAALDKK